MRDWVEIAERLQRSTVRVFTGDRGSGSGVVWSADGLIVTNAHVARGDKAEIELWDGRRFQARVEARDPRRDFARLRIAARGLEAVAAGDSEGLRAGEAVIAVGNPLGFAGVVSTGVVHSVGALPGMGRQRWIRTSVRLAPGNSGGPLASAEGRVVGINTAIVNGLGVAAPSAAVVDFVQRGGAPTLGVTLRALPFGLAILEIDRGAAAASAGLQVGDVLLCRLEELGELLDSGADIVRLRFLRGERVRDVAVTIGARAEAA